MKVKYKNYIRKGTIIDGYRAVDHPLYPTFCGMHRRCSLVSDSSYPNYGARGIEVCERWNGFENFVIDMGPKPTPEHSIERVDNELGYSPDNCVWGTRSEQCFNRRTFKNNTSGARGVKPRNKGLITYLSVFDYELKRYTIGHFLTFEEAEAARSVFIDGFFKDRGAAVASLPVESKWLNSKTNSRGVTPHKDGGFIARCTINGERHYVGYFKTIEEASDARQKRITQGA